MSTFKTFEDYLRDQHADDYIGTDDDMPDAYENWLCDLDNQELIDYAEMYGELKLIEGQTC